MIPDLFSICPCLVLDVETTGLDPRSGHKIIQLGCAILEVSGRIADIRHQKFNPGRHIPEQATKIHGIHDWEVRDKPAFTEAWPKIQAWIEKQPVKSVAGHNVGFDLGFLKLEIPWWRTWLQDKRVIDTKDLAREIDGVGPYERGYRLVDLVAKHGIKTASAHHAGHDAEATARLLYILCMEGVRCRMSR
jgi:DNA polymerase III alpha subunit (gram-positive type)